MRSRDEDENPNFGVGLQHANLDRWEFPPIGYVRSCFKEKFGIPRQSGMAPASHAVLKLKDDPFYRIAVTGLEGFSHLWVIWVFHQHNAKGWKPSIRPPRLGGAKKRGVLASRSPHRPNPIGLSVVELERIDVEAPGGIEIHVRNVDVLEGTPILDIKPYLPFADAVPGARAGWAQEPIRRVPVTLTEKAEQDIQEREKAHPGLRELVIQLVELDPRPAFQRKRMPPDEPQSEGTDYGFKLLEYDVKWAIRGGQFVVLELVDL